MYQARVSHLRSWYNLYPGESEEEKSQSFSESHSFFSGLPAVGLPASTEMCISNRGEEGEDGEKKAASGKEEVELML